MIRLITCFFYMVGYLIYSIPNLNRMKKLKLSNVSEEDAIIHAMPKKWSRTIMKLTGSNVRVLGQENIPEGPVVFISNHEGNFDIPTLLGFIDKPFGFISKVEVKKVPLISTWMEVMKCVFLDRSNRRGAVQSIREGTEILRQGHSLVIFPEGTRSKGGEMKEFKSGTFRIAKDAEVPILPLIIKGTSNVYEKNNRMIRPANITIEIAPPIDSSIYKDLSSNDMAVMVENIVRTKLKEN